MKLKLSSGREDTEKKVELRGSTHKTVLSVKYTFHFECYSDTPNTLLKQRTIEICDILLLFSVLFQGKVICLLSYYNCTFLIAYLVPIMENYTRNMDGLG